MKSTALSIFGFAALAAVSSAQTKTFNVVGDKLAYRNLATFESVSDYETFTGRTNEVSGSLKFDPTTKKGSGKIVVSVKGIDTGIPLRNEHMQSAGWLDAANYPTISFEAIKAVNVGGDRYKVTGKLSLHGVTKTVNADVRLGYRAAGPEVVAKGFNGDLVKVTANFKVKLSDYGVKIPDMAAGKVANEVTVSLTAYATTK